MAIRKELLGGTIHKRVNKKEFIVEIIEENTKLLKAINADVFEPVKKKEKKVKFEGIKEDDDSDI